MGSFYCDIFNTSFTLGPYRILHNPTRDIKRIYCNLAKSDHPNKNCDGRAVEAFHALEASAAIVTNDKLRAEYDRRIVAIRRRRGERIKRSIVHVCTLGCKKSVVSYQLTKRNLGPFMSPIFTSALLHCWTSV